jgi:hypothetical protein
MPNYEQVDPYAASRGFNQMVQLGQQRREYADSQDQRRLDNQERNRLAQLQGERFGMEREKQQFDMQQQRGEAQSQALPRAGALMSQVLGITDPVQRRAAAVQAIQANPQIFDALGIPSAQQIEKLNASDDQTLEQSLMGLAKLAPQSKPMEVSAGASLVRPGAGGNYENVYTAPSTPEKQTDDIREYQLARSQGYKGGFYQYMNDLKQAGAQRINLPSGYKFNPDGSMAPVEGGPADPKNKPPTEADKKAAVMFSSMINAENMLAKLPGGGADTASRTQRALSSVSLQSDEYRKYESAGLRWAANLLYLKSGATATPEEIKSTWKQFFPQPGDGDDVKAQKAQARGEEMGAVADSYNLDEQKIPHAPGAGGEGGGGTQPPQAPGGWSITPVP